MSKKTPFSNIHDTKDEDLWTYTGPPVKGTGKNTHKRRTRKQQMKEKSIWDIPAKPVVQESVEDLEGWRSFKGPSFRPKKAMSAGNSIVPKKPVLKRRSEEDLWAIPTTEKDFNEQASKMEDVVWSSKPTEVRNPPSSGFEPPNLVDPKAYTTMPKASTPPDPMQIKVSETIWRLEREQARLPPQPPQSAPSTLTSPKTETTAPPPFSLLLSLPTELQLSITDLLPTETILALRTTCHHLHTLLPPPSLGPLLALERTPWARNRRFPLWTCSLCLRLRPAPAFADTMVRGARGLNGKEPHKRFCVACGIRPDPGTRASRYAPGSEVIVSGVRHVFCRECRGYERELGGKGTGVCRGCHEEMGLGGMVRGVERGVNPGREKRARRGWRRGGVLGGRDPYGYESEDCELLDGYDSDFWESYDPAD
ncbi:uncharacterized protein BDZ99DRAFT_522553 [Mytilinidion resinicola]|uniref:F-box domain-containing protein n=1 Tax=Mytilinidion resinicola TaxID=574789 RepID=A0A6A6YJ47_9PEZI|nr:uncharacterized protein BDZ99DRAFT_522553 [Mytilinidion resinicola]KAF2807947.1 hypothetical protein BDZ99DRAFT_522553 [Mytilinidion resinicola]